MALSDNLISYWKMDEASGNAIDAHGSNDLMDNNTVGTGTGKINDARDFVRANSEYLSSSSSDFTFGDVDWTIALWVNFDNFSNYHALFSKQNSTPVGGFYEGYFLYATTAGGFTFIAQNLSENSFVSSPTGFPASTWHYVVATHDATANELALIVNDGTPSTTSHTGGSGSPTPAFTVGLYPPWPNLYIDGLIDEMGVWSKVLSGSEITELYNSGSGLSYADIAGGSASPYYNSFLHAQIAG